MASDTDNSNFEKTSFLQGGNSPFIKELYLQYLKNPTTVPESWQQFFEGLNEDEESIKKEILGPSWAPKKKINLKNNIKEKDLVKAKEISNNKTPFSEDSHEREKEQSVKAIALIRAYRIRGHLIANLDPLGMM